jgi:hypothetical protein
MLTRLAIEYAAEIILQLGCLELVQSSSMQSITVPTIFTLLRTVEAVEYFSRRSTRQLRVVYSPVYSMVRAGLIYCTVLYCTVGEVAVTLDLLTWEIP